MINPKLSILVISHNQKHLLSRCLNSVLKQKLNCAYEIIVSDDASTDGTWNIILDYASRYPQLRGVQTDSNQYYITVSSERGSINKMNAYSESKGEYVVFIDGDDYLLSDDIYQVQVEQLDKHPECFLCKQNMTLGWDGDLEDKWWKWEDKSPTGYVMSAKEYIFSDRMSCPAFMIRKHPSFRADGIFKSQCYDEFITYQYLKLGGIVCVGRADYMYVQYRNSILHSYDSDSALVRFAVSQLLYMYLIPEFEKDFFESGIDRLINFMKIATTRNLVVSNDVKAYLMRFNGFIFRYMSEEHHSLDDMLRLIIIRGLQLIQKKICIHCNWLRHLIFKLYTNFNSSIDIVAKE